MSISDPPGERADFDAWLAAEFAAEGAFTALVVLVEIAGTTVTPVSSTFLNVIGDEATWGDVAALLAESGAAWNAAAFFPARAPQAGGPLDNPSARRALADVTTRLDDDRLVLNEGCFVDGDGRRLTIEEVTAH